MNKRKRAKRSNPRTRQSVKPYGGKLRDLIVSPKRATELKALCVELPSWDLTSRQLYDLELLMNGAFSPLEGFMGKNDYLSVVEDMRLSNDTLWPIPVVLDITKEFAAQISAGDRLALRSPEGVVLAILNIEDTWEPDLFMEAERVYGTKDKSHPGVAYLLEQTNPVYLGGSIEGLEYPEHHSFKSLRHTPEELRKLFAGNGWDKVVAFQTRNPLHRAHYELTRRAAQQTKANLLLHPVVGSTRPGDVEYHTRVRCYQLLLEQYPKKTAFLSLLPLAMRMAGPREALWHAIIRRNYGCTYFIVGRDHAGSGKDSKGRPFYGTYEAQDLAKKHEEELGIVVVPFEEMVYVEEHKRYLPSSQVTPGTKALSLSGSELRERLLKGLPVPEWFSFPEVITELRKAYPERSRQGFTIFFTGLSGSGKSTIANVLLAKLMEIGGRPITLLDGDIVRKHLSSELNFSKEHRDINVRRIGFVASEITKNRGIAICAPIAPYGSVRKDVREMVLQCGGFILIYVSTPVEVCELRDRKGLYAKARAGLIKGFTGIDDPYEEPKDANLAIDTSDITPGEAAQNVMDYLNEEGYIA